MTLVWRLRKLKHERERREVDSNLISHPKVESWSNEVDGFPLARKDLSEVKASPDPGELSGKHRKRLELSGTQTEVELERISVKGLAGESSACSRCWECGVVELPTVKSPQPVVSKWFEG